MKSSAKLPFMSVVINTYNGEATIGRTLDSLLAQDYPKDLFEIIVVDDGSTDATAEIVAQHTGVRYVQLAQNVGISDARNAGLAAVKGEVYAAFDDDCIATRDWLKQLAKGYALPNAAGVGGYLADESPARDVVTRYRSVTGAGFAPAPPAEGEQKSLFRRLFAYLTSGLHRFDETAADWVEVCELYGANSSFPVDVLRAVGGWSKEMTGIEDRDISLRILKRFPKRHFYAIKSAKITHDPMMSLSQYLLRPYRRGLVNFRFHHANNITPPLFPFPVVLFVAACATAVLNYMLVPATLLLLPQLLYFWWPYYAAQKRSLSYLLFPYLQLAEETMVLVGLLRGFVFYIRGAYADR